MLETKLPIRRKEINCDSDQRLRVYIDLDAKKIDACYVALLGDETFVQDFANEGWTHERLWAETLRTAAWLRTEVSSPYPANVFVPYVEVTLTDRDRVAAQCGLRTAMLTGYAFEDQDWERRIESPGSHEDRVRALAQAWDCLTVLRIGIEQ
jgi:hypothetical protein